MADFDERRCAGAGAVGRSDAELRLLDAFLGRLTSDGTSLVLVGEPGVGKTALLESAGDLANSRGIRVARGSGVEFEQELSFSGLQQVLFPLLHRVPELDEPHRAALGVALGLGDGRAPDRLVISTAALALVRAAAAAEPLLLVVDDVQWLDAASSGVLGFVGRRLAGSRAGLLAACRPDEAASFRSAMAGAHEVPPLDPAAAAALLGRRLPSLTEWTRGRILDEAQGYPLALLELPIGLGQRRREPDDGLAAALPLSRRLQELFRARVAELPVATRRLLLLAALDGTGKLSVLTAAKHGRGLADLVPAEHGRLVTPIPTPAGSGSGTRSPGRPSSSSPPCRSGARCTG